MRIQISGEIMSISVVDQKDIDALQAVKDEKGDSFDSDDVMAELFEPLVCNSELSFCTADETGDLTDAPMLCFRDEDGHVMARWAFMDYQVISLQEKLLRDGKAVLRGGELHGSELNFVFSGQYGPVLFSVPG